MNQEDFYRQWIEHRRKVGVPSNFDRRVMAAVKAQETKRLPIIVSDQWGASAMGRRAAALGLILLGILRLAYIAGQLVVAGQIVP